VGRSFIFVNSFVFLEVTEVSIFVVFCDGSRYCEQEPCMCDCALMIADVDVAIFAGFGVSFKEDVGKEATG